MNKFYEDAGLRIRRFREKRSYSREELAGYAEISPKFLYEIETGRRGFSADTLFRISKALSVSSECILEDGNEKNDRMEIEEILTLFDHYQLMQVRQILNLIYQL